MPFEPRERLESGRFQWSLRPEARVYWPRMQYGFSTAFPFGLCDCRRRVELTEPLIVGPRILELSDLQSTWRIGVGVW